MLVPTELAKVEKFVAGLNYETRKALTVSKPRTLNEAYLSATDLYRVQQLQRGSNELAWKRSEGSGSQSFKRPRQDFRARPAPPQSQGSTRVESGEKGKPFGCRRCGKEHIGKDCQGKALQCLKCGKGGHKALQCFKCGRRGHKAYEFHLESDQGALPSSTRSGGPLGGSSSRG
ncbi:PREDICTED: uncharacterized protein LOC109183835 [Ipomoea nil]|uniref:uncharacterized protein LOC109183835 n=1 Tax=Ipomoea nil TaxID=35883 RepID=UPI0009013850|nr:PREDICTED: uncharacterized protein LOC109183835 [Ipomoea nil]